MDHLLLNHMSPMLDQGLAALATVVKFPLMYRLTYFSPVNPSKSFKLFMSL